MAKLLRGNTLYVCQFICRGRKVAFNDVTQHTHTRTSPERGFLGCVPGMGIQKRTTPFHLILGSIATCLRILSTCQPRTPRQQWMNVTIILSKHEQSSHAHVTLLPLVLAGVRKEKKRKSKVCRGHSCSTSSTPRGSPVGGSVRLAQNLPRTKPLPQMMFASTLPPTPRPFRVISFFGFTSPSFLRFFFSSLSLLPYLHVFIPSTTLI